MSKHKSHNIQETSMISWDGIQLKMNKRHEEIYEAIKTIGEMYGDATDHEVKVFLEKKEPNYVRPRRFELVNELILIGFSKKRKCRVTGKTAMAWKVLQRRIKDYENRKVQKVQEVETTNEAFFDRTPSAAI